MNEKLFRKKTMDKITSPNQLTEYIRVANPGVWMILTAIIIFLVGVCVWGVFGRMDTKLTVAAVSEDSGSLCYIKEEDISSVKPGMVVLCEENEYIIESISSTPIAVDETINDYAKHVGSLQTGEWVYTATLDGALPEGTYPAEIITNSVAPMSFVFN